MKPLYLKPEQNKTPREQWESLNKQEQWEEYLNCLVAIDELGDERDDLYRELNKDYINN